MLPKDADMATFMQMASQVLEIKAQRAFFAIEGRPEVQLTWVIESARVCMCFGRGRGGGEGMSAHKCVLSS